jgi:hypothetical protein
MPAQPALHAADVSLHSATQAPDNPQFIAQENPSASQREMHWDAVRACASLSFPTNVPATLAVGANRSKATAAAHLMVSLRECA